jgi:hypothetical protein
MIQALTEAYWSLVQLSSQVDQFYNIDSAVGTQLDVLGQWIGFSRKLDISKRWFSFNELYEGFDLGNWYVFGDVPYESVTLTDQLYRVVLKAKILINQFDGTRSSFEAILSQLFSLDDITFQVVQESPMNIVVTVIGSINQIIFFLITENILDFTPVGVNITWEFES